MLSLFSAEAQDDFTPAKEAGYYLGKTTSICDSVYSTKTLDNMTFFNFGGNCSKAPLTIVIYQADKVKFTVDPAIAYNNKRICVNGEVIKYKDAFQIVVKNPNQMITYQKYQEINKVEEGIRYEPINIPIAFEEKPIINPETPPEYIGGMQAWLNHLAKNLNYPTKAKDLGIKGKVQVGFIIEKDGRLTDLIVYRGLGYGCDEEALRLVKTGSKFNPVIHHGKIVRAFHSISIKFE